MKLCHLSCLGGVFIVSVLGLALTAAATSRKPAIGSTAGELHFKDIRFSPRTLKDIGPAKAYVIVFTTSECPLVKRYWPRLKQLSSHFEEQGARFLSINVGPEDSLKEIAYQAIEYDVEFPCVKDFDGDCAGLLGVNYTPEVVVLDGDFKIRYRGHVNTQFRLGGENPSAGREDLQEAIEDVLAGRKVRVEETTVDGCAITRPEATPKRTSLTYAKNVAPILNQHCVECHRPGTPAPFSLTSYEKVAAKAGTIAEAVAEERMPPWFAHPGFGDFINQRGLTAAERNTVIEWARGGKPAGDLAKAPTPRNFPETKWQIGEPDLVITATQPEKLPATGVIPYRYVILPRLFEHDTWVQGIEIMPGNPRVVHHANLAFATLPFGFDENRNFLTGKVPGGIAVDLASGIAMMIPKGSVLALQIHYVTTGKEETDQVSVGLRFAKEPVHKRVRYKIIADYRFKIPPGAPAHRVAAQKTLEADATGIGLFSHMHLRGKDSTFFAHYPNGTNETLLALPNYSFDWQLSYVWRRGTRQFPKGTQIECVSHFDNSAFNPFNPDPNATVKNGPQTFNEMMQGFFFYTVDAEDLNLQIDPKTGKELKKQAAVSR